MTDKPPASNAEWEHWGSTDPLYAVASWTGKERGGTDPWTDVEFVRLGESDFLDIERHWKHYGVVAGQCFEIGCGAGRMTGPLLRLFETIVAVDVSPHQIERAKRLLGDRARRVTFHVVTGTSTPIVASTCTGMFSTHVLQHLSSFETVASYLQEAHRVLQAGGTICFHVPSDGAHRAAHTHPLRLAFHNAKARLLRRLGGRRTVEYHRYSAQRVFDCLTAIGFNDLELRVFSMRSNGDAHSFFFGRKS